MLYTERPLLELAGWGLLGVGWQAGWVAGLVGWGGWSGGAGWGWRVGLCRVGVLWGVGWGWGQVGMPLRAGWDGGWAGMVRLQGTFIQPDRVYVTAG